MNAKHLIAAIAFGLTLGTTIGVASADEKQNVITLPEVVIVGHAPKKMVCGNYQETLAGGYVRRCEWK